LKEKYEVSLARDVMPTISRMGCTAATCHRSAGGKNGFKLPLRGYDPQLDHRALTHDLEGPRFNRPASHGTLRPIKTAGAGAYAAATFVIMGDRRGFEWQNVEEYNYIDTLVYEKLKQVKVLPSELCTDGEFIRRLYLDLTGLPPEPEQVRAFIADPRPSRVKR